jgi:hypothetical protein
MTKREFFDWQTAGGADDVMRFVDALERAQIKWCVIGGIAVNHWAQEPMVTRDVDFVVATDQIQAAKKALVGAGFQADEHQWSVNFSCASQVAIQLTTEDFYRQYPERAVAADVHGILMRVASLEDTLRGKVKAWGTQGRRPSKKLKDLTDISRLIEAHPNLRAELPAEVLEQLQ